MRAGSNWRHLNGLSLGMMGDPVRCLPKVVHPDVAALKLQHNRVLAATVTEHLRTMLAVGALEKAHVLYQAKNRDLQVAKHLQTFAGVNQADILRRGDHHTTGQWCLLTQCQLGVAGTGW